VIFAPESMSTSRPAGRVTGGLGGAGGSRGRVHSINGTELGSRSAGVPTLGIVLRSGNLKRPT
jgi:hypothetical protein